MLLIAPEGIEILYFTPTIFDGFLLLIAPEGIEIRNRFDLEAI